MTQPNRGHDPMILHMDASHRSCAVEQALKRADVTFRAVFGSTSIDPLPAIETQNGILRGYDNIKRYLLPEMSDE